MDKKAENGQKIIMVGTRPDALAISCEKAFKKAMAEGFLKPPMQALIKQLPLFERQSIGRALRIKREDDLFD